MMLSSFYRGRTQRPETEGKATQLGCWSLALPNTKVWSLPYNPMAWQS